MPNRPPWTLAAATVARRRYIRTNEILNFFRKHLTLFVVECTTVVECFSSFPLCSELLGGLRGHLSIL